MNKISIRFYNDREVRAVWNEENFSIGLHTATIPLMGKVARKPIRYLRAIY